MSDADASLLAYERHQHLVPGWLDRLDLRLIGLTHDAQRQCGVTGDLLEIGAYLGRSAIALGWLVEAGERFYVCDLFEDPPSVARNIRESSRYYHDLTRSRFEANYTKFHPTLPTILQQPSTELASSGLGPTFRIIHVDGCHAHDVVRADILTVKELAADGCVVIFDDYRNHGLPGVAAAVWEAVASHSVRPLLLTPTKLYATWGAESHQVREALERLVAEQPGWHVEREGLFDYEVLALTEDPPSRLSQLGHLAQRLLKRR